MSCALSIMLGNCFSLFVLWQCHVHCTLSVSLDSFSSHNFVWFICQSPNALNSFLCQLVSSPVWFCANIEFALLSLTCSLPSLVGELTLAVVLLFDYFASLLCSLNSFSCQAIASTSWFCGKVEFAALSFSPSLPSPIGELTLDLTTLFNLFANLPSSLNSF